MTMVSKKTTVNHDIKEEKEFGDNHFHEEQQQQLIQALVSTLHHLSLDVLVSHGTDIRHHLRSIWEIFLKQGDEQTRQRTEAFVLVRTITLCAGQSSQLLEKNAILSNTHLTRLVSLTNFLTHELLENPSCHTLLDLVPRYPNNVHDNKVHNKMEVNGEAKVAKEMVSIESGMQELVKCVHQRYDGIDSEIKQVFLMVVKSYYYVAYCSPATIDHHIAKVIFERVA